MADAFVYRAARDLWYITGPSARLGRIAGAVIASGERLSFETPNSHQNMSYETEAFLPVLNCATANSTIRRDVLRFVNDTDLANPINRTADSLKWLNDRVPMSGEIGFLGLSWPTWGSGWDWNNTQEDTSEFAFAIQRSSSDSPHQSDTEYLLCEVWNATVAYTVRTRNGVVSIENIHRELLNKFEPRLSIVPLNSGKGAGSPAYVGFSLGLASYLLGYVAWNQDNTRHRFFSTGSLGTSSLSTGSQFYNMNRNMNEAGLVISNLQNPSSVRNISFREDVEAFALNLSLSIINDASLW